MIQIHVIKKHTNVIGQPINDYGGVGGLLSYWVVDNPFDRGPTFVIIAATSVYYIYVFIVFEVSTGENSLVNSGDEIAFGCCDDGGIR